MALHIDSSPKWCPTCATKRDWKNGVREDCPKCGWPNRRRANA